MAHRLITSFVLLFSLSFSFCENSFAQQKLRIAATSSFRPALKELIPLFEKKYAIKVQLRATSSGALFNQISNGAPFDVFLSANSDYPSKLAKLGLADASSRSTYALGILAWWQPHQPNPTLASEIHFKQPIALANPKLAPYGRAAEEVLTKIQQLGSTFTKKVTGANVSQAFQYVESGNAGGGFVAYSYLLSAKIKSNYWIIPSSWYQPIQHQAIRIKNSNYCNASKFLKFLLSDEARAIIAETGYALPPSFNQIYKPSNKIKGCKF